MAPELDLDDPNWRRRHALSFNDAADEYERGRPGYPGDAVDWLVGDARRVLELGAGTGKLTRLLVARGLSVVAVEPLDNMRTQLVRSVPGAQVRAGTAEDIPAGAGDFDLVLAAQAWHWVDSRTASAEVARVLRPGGALGLVWNERDNRVPWVAALSDLAWPPGDTTQHEEIIDLVDAFGPVERADFTYEQDLDRVTLLDMLASHSVVITLTKAERDRVLGSVAELVDTHPDTAGRDRFALPYVTCCYRAVLR